MKASVACGVKSLDLSPPLIDAFTMLCNETGEKIEGLGALQEWACKSFTIDDVALGNYPEEIKAAVRSRLPSGYLGYLEQSKMPEVEFIKSFFVPMRGAQPLTQHQIDDIRMKPEFFDERLGLYQKLNLKVVQFGGITADWLVSIGRIDLLEKLLQLITGKGFTPVLICHWTTIVLPVCEKELDGVSGYIVPVNKLWGLLTLPETLRVIKSTEKPIIAMKTLAQGALTHDLQNAFTFLFKEAGVAAVMVGVSSENEAKQTFLAIGKAMKYVGETSQ